MQDQRSYSSVGNNQNIMSGINLGNQVPLNLPLVSPALSMQNISPQQLPYSQIIQSPPNNIISPTSPQLFNYPIHPLYSFNPNQANISLANQSFINGPYVPNIDGSLPTPNLLPQQFNQNLPAGTFLQQNQTSTQLQNNLNPQTLNQAGNGANVQNQAVFNQRNGMNPYFQGQARDQINPMIPNRLTPNNSDQPVDNFQLAQKLSALTLKNPMELNHRSLGRQKSMDDQTTSEIGSSVSSGSSPASPNYGQERTGTEATMVSPAYIKPAQKDLCMRCGQRVYAMEKVGPIKGVLYHKRCFTCVVCRSKLHLNTYQTNSHDTNDLNIYCSTHKPLERSSTFDANAVHIKSALSVPKLEKVNEQIRGKSNETSLRRNSNIFRYNPIVDKDKLRKSQSLDSEVSTNRKSPNELIPIPRKDRPSVEVDTRRDSETVEIQTEVPVFEVSSPASSIQNEDFLQDNSSALGKEQDTSTQKSEDTSSLQSLFSDLTDFESDKSFEKPQDDTNITQESNQEYNATNTLANGSSNSKKLDANQDGNKFHMDERRILKKNESMRMDRPSQYINK